jgi:hypothetical protein
MNNAKDKIMAVVSVVIIAVVTFLGIQSHQYQKRAEKADCDRVIDTRDDYRVMWLETLGFFPQDDPIVVSLYQTLNERLPPYTPDTCPPVASFIAEP